MENMHQAWKQVKRNGGNPGVDCLTIEEFPDYLKSRWTKIKRALLLGYYVPSPVLKVEIPKKSGGKRMLGIPSVLDRVIQQAISQVLSPIFDPDFSESSHGFRTGMEQFIPQASELRREVRFLHFFPTFS